MRHYLYFAALLLAVGLTACQQRSSVETSTASAVPLSQMSSGYIGGVDRMLNFLRCWQRDIGVPSTGGISTSTAAAEVDSRLPQSARDFLIARAQLEFRSLYELKTGDSRRFADSAVLMTFKQFSPQDFANWKSALSDINTPDDSYFLYDKRQQGFRGRDLESMLVVGSEMGGAFYLLIPVYSTKDGEKEAMFLHHGGLIVRYKSFAHLLLGLYLEERERHAGRDPSMGHLYHYPGRLAETCAREIIDFKN